MFKKDYTYKLLEKENKHLTRENEHLRNQLAEISALKKEYQTLIADLKRCREKYAASLKKMSQLEKELHRELHLESHE